MQILVVPDVVELFAGLLPSDEIVLAGVAPERVIPALEDLRGRQVRVNTTIIEGTGVQEILSASRLGEHLDGLARQCSWVFRIARFDPKRVLIRHAGVLERIGARIEGPLQTSTDAEAFKVLTSIGVKTRIDLCDKNVDWTRIEDLLTDNFLAPVARAPLDPFTMLFGIDEDRQTRFSLASIYYDDCREYLQIDPSGRFYPSRARLAEGAALDATLADRSELAEMSPCAEATRALRSHLLDATDCAFCRGFRSCRAYLRGACSGSECAQMFTVFQEVSSLRRARSQARNNGGSGPRHVWRK